MPSDHKSRAFRIAIATLLGLLLFAPAPGLCHRVAAEALMVALDSIDLVGLHTNSSLLMRSVYDSYDVRDFGPLFDGEVMCVRSLHLPTIDHEDNDSVNSHAADNQSAVYLAKRYETKLRQAQPRQVYDLCYGNTKQLVGVLVGEMEQCHYQLGVYTARRTIFTLDYQKPSLLLAEYHLDAGVVDSAIVGAVEGIHGGAPLKDYRWVGGRVSGYTSRTYPEGTHLNLQFDDDAPQCIVCSAEGTWLTILINGALQLGCFVGGAAFWNLIGPAVTRRVRMCVD